MKKYSFTHEKYKGSISFWYNENDILVHYNNDTDMTDTALVWFLNNIPRNLDELESLKKTTKGTLIEVPQVVTFDAFWDTYAKKCNRKRCETIWVKMTEAQKLKAIISVQAYDRYLQRVKWRSKADPDTYLRNQNYDTDWNKVFE